MLKTALFLAIFLMPLVAKSQSVAADTPATESNFIAAHQFTNPVQLKAPKMFKEPQYAVARIRVKMSVVEA